MPADALRFVEELKGSYEQVSGFLQNSELVRQVRSGATLEQTALALIDDVLALFRKHLANLGTTIFDAETLERVKTALAAIDSMASKKTVPADQLLEFLSKNLLGVAPDLLGEANQHVRTALAVLDPFSRASLEARIAAARDARRDRVQERRRCAGGVRSRQPCGLCAARGAVADARLRTGCGARGARSALRRADHGGLRPRPGTRCSRPMRRCSAPSIWRMFRPWMTRSTRWRKPSSRCFRA